VSNALKITPISANSFDVEFSGFSVRITTSQNTMFVDGRNCTFDINQLSRDSVDIDFKQDGAS
jgi:hypothetical protein